MIITIKKNRKQNEETIEVDLENKLTSEQSNRAVIVWIETENQSE